MRQIKEVIKLVKKVKSDLWDYTSPNVNVKNEKLSEDIELLDQVLAKLQEPKCDTCGGSRRKIQFLDGQREFGGDASTSYEIPCPDCQAQEQPPTGEFREIVAKFLREFEMVDEARNLYGVRDILSEACIRLNRFEAMLKEYGGQRCKAVCSRCKKISHWCLLPQGHTGEHIYYCQFKFLEARPKDLLVVLSHIKDVLEAARARPTEIALDWEKLLASFVEDAIGKANKEINVSHKDTTNNQKSDSNQ